MKKIIFLGLYLFISGCINNSLNNFNIPDNSNNINKEINPIISVMPSILTSPPVISYEGAKQLNASEISGYSDPLISMNSQGKFVLAYTKIRKGKTFYYGGESGYAIYLDSYARTFDKMGNPISEEIKVEENSRVETLSIDNNDDFIVSYVASGYTKTGAYIKKYNINGGVLGETLINKNDNSNQKNFYSNITRNLSGDYFLTWITAENNPQPYVNSTYNQFLKVEINTQKYNSSLKPISDIYITKLQSNNLVNISSKVDKNDNYYISWVEQKKINLIKFDLNGKVLIEKPNLFTENFINQEIIIDNDENIIFCWMEEGDQNSVYIRKYDKQMNKIKDKRVVFEQNNIGYKPSVTIDNNTNLTITWLGTYVPYGNSSLFTKKYDKNLESLTEESLVNNLSTNRAMTYISNDKDNNLYIFFKSEGEKCYLKKFDKEGKLLSL